MAKVLRLGVFASGRGSNFQAIAHAIQRGDLKARLSVLVSNNPEAGAIAFAGTQRIPAEVVNRKDFSERSEFVETLLSALKRYDIDIIVLAGYMKKIPAEIITAYRDRILNIHPALLPAFGGQGMYGRHVHEAVINQGCRVTGVTIHVVDEVYDRGPIVAQACVPVLPGDTPESLASRVLKTEHTLYWKTLQRIADGSLKIRNGKVIEKPS